MLFRMIDTEVAAEKLQQPTRQLFVTKSRTLANKVKTSFQNIRGYVNTGEGQSTFTLRDIDEDAEVESELPSRISLLQDEHFPLFLTFDQVCFKVPFACVLLTTNW